MSGPQPSLREEGITGRRARRTGSSARLLAGLVEALHVVGLAELLVAHDASVLLDDPQVELLADHGVDGEVHLTVDVEPNSREQALDAEEQRLRLQHRVGPHLTT